MIGPRVRLAFVFLLAAACRDSLPTAPTELTAGAIIYQHANFLGPAVLITGEISNLRDFKGPCEQSDGESSVDSWDDCVSSIRLAPGWRATLYEDSNFKGWAADVGEENVANYQLVKGPCKHDTFNDCASSLRVFRIR